MKRTYKNKEHFLLFEDARENARDLKIDTYREWKEYCQQDKPSNTPSCPDIFYRNAGWVDWYDWLGKDKDRRKYTINDNYFSTWSSDMAYILGFWFADGYIDKSKNIFSISQHKNNDYILCDILKKMESNYKLYYHKNMCRMEIRSETIIKDIIKLGGKEQKSLNSNFPFVPLKLLPDFTRGLWDGDGCISFAQKSYISTFTCGSFNFISNFQQSLENNIPYFKCSFTESSKNRKNTIYYIRVAPNSTRRLHKFMYKNRKNDTLMLKNKYEKFKKNRNYL